MSPLDDLLSDARSLRKTLSKHDQKTLDESLQSVRESELKVEKAKRPIDIPLPNMGADHLQFDVTPEGSRNYLQTMFELIYLAFKLDSTRVVTYDLGRENGTGVSDYLARAVGFNLTNQLTHSNKAEGSWKNIGTSCRFISEEFGRFAGRLKSSPESRGEGTMLHKTVLLFGSASNALHLSRNYPLLLLQRFSWVARKWDSSTGNTSVTARETTILELMPVPVQTRNSGRKWIVSSCRCRTPVSPDVRSLAWKPKLLQAARKPWLKCEGEHLFDRLELIRKPESNQANRLAESTLIGGFIGNAQPSVAFINTAFTHPSGHSFTEIAKGPIHKLDSSSSRDVCHSPFPLTNWHLD